MPSKSEVAFRFVACTGIALALYYTPELKCRPAAHRTPRRSRRTPSSARPMPNAALDACAARKASDLLVDAAMRAN